MLRPESRFRIANNPGLAMSARAGYYGAMDFKTYWQGMPMARRARYAARARVSTSYIDKRLIHGYRTPRLDTIERLARASRGLFSVGDLASWFARVARSGEIRDKTRSLLTGQ